MGDHDEEATAIEMGLKAVLRGQRIDRLDGVVRPLAEIAHETVPRDRRGHHETSETAYAFERQLHLASFISGRAGDPFDGEPMQHLGVPVVEELANSER
ncbi:MAG: hypothetical protein F2754_02630 [Actinobacteria bacterium]|nr:hypothetical protein [Actinomycetota bacterium]